ncbi:MAG: endonuclease MutS2, partial [Chloroflexi bacterium]|nr:endonuclease MutS2 [Chloroflexota bacterium]
MRTKSLSTLEFPKVRARLAEYAAFSASQELALALEPAWSLETVTRWVRATTEARRLLDLRPNLDIGGARDVRPSVNLARRGGVLLPEAYLEIMVTLASARALKGSILRHRDVCPVLADTAEWMEERPDLERAIAQTIDEQGQVRDSASPALGRIRRDLRVTHGRLMEKLNAIVASSRGQAVLQESLITMRDGRYCLPIKADFKGRFNGVVHDQSASGATVFVEPLA